MTEKSSAVRASGSERALFRLPAGWRFGGEFAGERRLDRFVAGVDHRDEPIVHPDRDVAPCHRPNGSSCIKFALPVLGQRKPDRNSIGFPVAQGLGREDVLLLQQDLPGGAPLLIRGDAVPQGQGRAGGEDRDDAGIVALGDTRLIGEADQQAVSHRVHSDLCLLDPQIVQPAVSTSRALSRSDWLVGSPVSGCSASSSPR